jgi:regulator of ribonuclease activity A
VTPARATADLCDAFPDRVRVALGIFRDWGGISAFAGPIETVRVLEDNALIRQALEGHGGGRVLVVDGGASSRTALVGGNLAALAEENGWAGLVINGCVRDSAEIAETKVGVKALGTSPMRPAKAGHGERGISVTFAGVTFVPGHWLYADIDGMVVSDSELIPD